ncbi:YbhB/YbcL family Raf kinase inhibitor-like protein [Streptomyces yokosukanensis]|uniref:YbhB/YbcL family Raf kinase inhibitor-like protein n=1 Tax=Streptomyces yokosukanensis TaxID=67386 RepID=UPI000B0955F2|nr:YbhB/YbcL family Raf kinase inhibitor-like protein [Streptomyces yokosukanensis]
MRQSWVTAMTAVATMSVAAGCGDGTGQAAAPSPAAAHRLTVTSSAYGDGGTIPRRHTCDGADVSPPLALAAVPAHTAALALLLRDTDAPHGAFTHWLVWDVDPRTRQLSAGEHPQGATEGRNDFERPGYGGPCPPRGDRPHHYVLTVYASDRRVALSAQASPTDLLRTLSGHTLGTGTLMGRYSRG